MLIKESLKQQINLASNNPGVYQFIDENSKVLYVGKAKNLAKRLNSYTKITNLSPRIARMVSLAGRLEMIETKTESEALLLECNLIKKLLPNFNILLRDSKSFPYIMISSDHDFGQITKHRGKKTRKGYYFGPFAAVSYVNEVIDILKKSFLLRSCSDSEFKGRKKPCLEYQIKRCSGPCVELISKVEYQQLVSQAVGFLSGKTSSLQEQLAKQMQAYSQNMEYEKATVIRDRIRALSSIQAKQNISLSWLKDVDVIALVKKANLICVYIAFYRSGYNYGSKPYFVTSKQDEDEAEIMAAFLTQFYFDNTAPESLLISHLPQDQGIINDFFDNIGQKKTDIILPKSKAQISLVEDYLKLANKQIEQKLVDQAKDFNYMTQLKALLKLDRTPQKIEVYDNSHISNQYMVGAMIASGNEGFIKNDYRKFNIRKEDLDKTDDCALLKQVLTRRFSRLKKEDPNKDLGMWPDLIIIDGGKGQLSAASEVFGQLEINDQSFVCMSKGEKRNAGEEYFHKIGLDSFTLPTDSALMYYLQRLRDEAHRFAIGTHRAKRAKSISKSELDEIPNIGRSRKMSLLNHFGSVSRIKEASIDDLLRVKGISKNIAQKIIDHLKV